MEPYRSMNALNIDGERSDERLQLSKDQKSEAWNHFPQSRHESKLSPAEEVTELASLNSKLSRYIDRVRSLQGENMKLTKYVCSVEKSQIKESEQMHLLYREKIENLKKEKERISRQVSHLGATYDNILKENKELKSSLFSVDKDLKARDERQYVLEKEVHTFRENSTKSTQENESRETLLAKMKLDQNKFTEQLERISNKTEKLSEECQNLCERLKINSGLMNQKLADLKSTSETKDTKQDQGGQTQNLVSSFQDKLGNGKDCENNVSGLISKLHTDLFEQIKNVTFQEFQLHESKSKVRNLELKIKNLLDEQEIIKERMKRIDNMKEINSLNYQTEIKSREKEIEMILKKTQKQTEEFKNLLEEKQGLDTEIAVFKKLVETEEERLGFVVIKDDVKVFEKSGLVFTFVGEKERSTRRKLTLTERQL